jgi:nucleotide-binding universal stress UspA family protein
VLKYTLVGYDGSDTARRAFQFAVELARISGGRVRVVSVLQVAEAGPNASAVMMADASSDRSRHLLEELTALVPDAHELIDVDIALGSPGDVLINQVRQHGIDHVVIGHTERGTLARWLLGSVSVDILANAHVPVTVIR